MCVFFFKYHHSISEILDAEKVVFFGNFSACRSVTEVPKNHFFVRIPDNDERSQDILSEYECPGAFDAFQDILIIIYVSDNSVGRQISFDSLKLLLKQGNIFVKRGFNLTSDRFFEKDCGGGISEK